MLPERTEAIIRNLPDAESARRFYQQLAEKFPAELKKLDKNEGLLSDLLTIAAFSPLLGTTVLQNPHYIAWLNRQRKSTKVRGKDELIESLARFASTNTSLEINVLLARFRRRELLRIYLRDIRGLATVAEITEEISNLADAILEYALRHAAQELDNRFGAPLETDEKNRTKPALFCIVALGKLGSRELNYSSDIDLLFLYSSDGTTSGRGSRGAVTNREYFIKLAELITKLVGGQSGEGAAYRVDLRLRPHGRVGALAISLNEAINYYKKNARAWERQVLIRSRACAGAFEIFERFFEQIESNVFSVDETVENALRNVRLSKEKINAEKISDRTFNVKLGKGGIREIEFIAQALQLAFAGKDEWLRAPHTLISLSRLADRRLISDAELTELFEAYDFFRCLEHRLQMENGLQTHTIPTETERVQTLARRMKFDSTEQFEATIKKHSENVHRIFTRVFGNFETNRAPLEESSISKYETSINDPALENSFKQVITSLSKLNSKTDLSAEQQNTLELLSKITPYYTEMLAVNPNLVSKLPAIENDLPESDYKKILFEAVSAKESFNSQISILRQKWSGFFYEIVVFDALGKITRKEAKRRQTALAEASLEAALIITRSEIEKKYSITIDEFPLAILGLGKLGGGGVDYGSDLDLVLIYDDEKPLPIENLTPAEFYRRAVEIFVTALSSLTRDGFLYRVDLRLRPDGKNGATSIGKTAFLNYLKTRAAVWEWLAYVKIRAIAGDLILGVETEAEARRIIHENAQQLKHSENGLKTLIDESERIRERLKTEKSTNRSGKEIDIKFDAGGMLDVYFPVRFLQLRDNVPDDSQNRSTVSTLEKLHARQSLAAEDYRNFSEGYEFLTELDHYLRLSIGRSSKIPLSNQMILKIVADRMRLSSVQELFEKLTVHRLNIRESFEKIFNTPE